MRNSNPGSLVVALACVLVASACTAVREMPPGLPGSFAGIPLNGGRTQSVSVSPVNEQHVLLSLQFGGLWKTTDGGAHWRHVGGVPAVFASDVRYGRDGNTVIATTSRDGRTQNGAGIWLSRDGGASWSRPVNALVPVTGTSPPRGSAWGISQSLDDPNRWYVGTDHGVARSADNGATWEHVVPDPALFPNAERDQGAVNSVLTMGGGTVLAMMRHAIYRSDDHGGTWRRVRNDDFNFSSRAVNKMDRSPYWEYAFILKNYDTLLFYELGSGRWTEIPLPPGAQSRGPFVRVGKPSFSGGYTQIWIGQGTRAAFVSRKRVSSIRNISAGDWSIIGRGEGIHDDMGDLGLNANFRPVMIGSDGGVFRPNEGNVRAWVSAAPNGSGMNSYLITDLAGNNVTQADGSVNTTLYYATQDNAIWSSEDYGVTWPNSDCAEGFHLETRPTANAGDPLTVAYSKVGCGPSGNMFSDRHLLNQRAVPDVDTAGGALTNMGAAFYIKNDHWIRARMLPGGAPEIFVSTDNGASWRKRFDITLGLAGVPQRSKAHYPAGYVKAYLPVFTGTINPDGSSRVGLIRLFNMFQTRVNSFADSSVINLPGNGSLGVRATEFDWQAVFGAHLKDWRFVIAPDIVAGDVKITRNGGDTWTTHANLTAEVTRNGRFILYDANQYRMQVTHIGFDPYRDDRILVGTRDAGVICSNDGGNTWGQVRGSERMLYVTGFQFRPDGTTVVSTYGRGLWKIRPGGFACRPTRWPRPILETATRVDLPTWRRELARIDETPDSDERTEPYGRDDPLVPRIVLSSDDASTGQVLVGEDEPLYVRGKGFDAAGGPLEVEIDGRKNEKFAARIEPGGTFTFKLQLPPELEAGEHVLEIIQRSGASIRRARMPFVKAPLDEDLGEEKTESVFREQNEKPGDEGPLDEQEKGKPRNP